MNKKTATAEKKVTRPWDDKHDESRSWRPDYVRLSKKHKGFAARWVRKDRVDMRKMAGYLVARPEDYGIDDIGTLDGKPLGNYVQRNELILMEVPDEILEKRKDAMEQRIKATAKAHKSEVVRELGDVNRQLADAGHEAAELIDETEGIR